MSFFLATFVINLITIMNNRLKQFLSAENISQSQFADTIQVVRASVSHVLSGRNNPGYDFIKAIMNHYPNLNIEWLILGKGKMYKDSALQNENLFVDDDLYAPEKEDVPFIIHESLPEIQIPQENHIHEQLNTINNLPESSVNQRKAKKIVIFFDDGTYQEMGY